MSHKIANLPRWKADQERRRSNVAVPHRNKRRYYRPAQKRIREDY